MEGVGTLDDKYRWWTVSGDKDGYGYRWWWWEESRAL